MNKYLNKGWGYIALRLPQRDKLKRFTPNAEELFKGPNYFSSLKLTVLVSLHTSKISRLDLLRDFLKEDLKAPLCKEYRLRPDGREARVRVDY